MMKEFNAPLGTVKVLVVQEVAPNDDSEPLPCGRYVVSDVELISGNEKTWLVTFVVAGGDGRRIAVIDADSIEC
jgi:hypothetical protein